MTNETIGTAALATRFADAISAQADMVESTGGGKIPPPDLTPAEARALAALLRGVVWRSIETAPTGEEFLAPSADKKTIWTVRVFDHPRKGRMVINGRTGLLWKSSHWMPLPAPPLTTKEG